MAFREPVRTLGDNPYLQKVALGQFVLVRVTSTNGVRHRRRATSLESEVESRARARVSRTNAMACDNLEAETAIGGDINPDLSQEHNIVFDYQWDASTRDVEVA